MHILMRVNERRAAAAPIPGWIRGLLHCWFLVCIVLTAPLVTRAGAQELLEPGEAFLTRFSGTTMQGGRTILDTRGTVGSIIDLRRPGGPPRGAHWSTELRRSAVTAGQVGQVFGVAFDDASPPNIYLTATAAFGLHRTADNSGWMAGLWGPGGGPGTVWKLSAANKYRPEIFAQITLDGRPNTGAALGNIAFDRWNRQLYVSDIETGMTHRLRLSDGADLGTFDHGVTGRANFLDATSGAKQSLPAAPFDPASAARTGDCPTGDFARTPSCWNFADFRRRVWGLGVRRDPANQEVRLYYAVWSSQGFGHPDFAGAVEDEQRNTLWSVRIAEKGGFDAGSVRREVFLPDFFRAPEAIARAGRSHPVSDIAFPARGDQTVMLLAERGGVRNFGLAAENAFAHPNEARVLRYERDDQGVWRPAGRYDVGNYDRRDAGPPYMRAAAAGGVTFAMGYGESWEIDPEKPDAFVWMSGDGLCSRKSPCFDVGANARTDSSQVHGIQGRAAMPFEAFEPPSAFQPYPAPGPVTPPAGADRSLMIDADADGDPARNDATRIGDIEAYQPEAKTPDLRIAKRTQAERCDPGAACAFVVEIENSGNVPYEGPLVVLDTVDGNAALASHSPGDWSCEPVFERIAGTYRCRREEVSLAPGETVALELTFAVPDSWTGTVYSNCVELVTPDIREDARRYNNRACAYVPTIQADQPPRPGQVPYGPDIRVEKYAYDATCDVFGNCPFVVVITNVGSADYTGPLSISDVVSTPGTALADWIPQPQWTCAAGPVAGSYDCTHLAAVTLSPGESREIILVVQGPPLVAGHTHVRNCARFEWQGAERDYNPGNEFACAEIYRYPPGHPGAVAILTVDKDAEPTCFQPGGGGTPWFCLYVVHVTNTGGIPYDPPLEFTDAAVPHPATLLGYMPMPDWTCVPGVGGVGVQTCTHAAIPGGLLPGETRAVLLAFELPAGVPVPSVERNCAQLMWDSDGDGVAEAHEACADALICSAGVNCPPDLALLKWAPAAPCDVGNPCTFDLGVQNLAGVMFPGPLTIDEIPGTDLGPPTFVPGGWACVPAGGTYQCTNPIAIPPGGFPTWQVSFDLPADYPAPSFENCARSTVPDIWPDNNEDCAIAQVPAPDLAPWSPSSCTRGQSCDLDVRIDNRGSRPFKGDMGLKGTLSPAVPVAGIASTTPGLTCQATGAGAYECEARDITVAPRSAATLTLTVTIPADFPNDAITHTKEMLWPDSRVKDKRPENDKHVSTIDILGPKESTPAPPPPAPPAPPSGQAAGADLAVSKTAKDPSCTAGQPCGFAVTVTNRGAGAYTGALRLFDVIAPPGARLTYSGPAPWSCRAARGRYTCTAPSMTLRAGESTSFSLVVTTARKARGTATNCAELSWTDAARVAAAQRALNDLGIPAGTPDGKLGPRTGKAIRDYQARSGLRPTGRVDAALLRKLFGSWGGGDLNAANDKACARVDLRAAEPPPVVEPGPRCQRGWVQISRGRVEALTAQGWEIKRRTRGGRTILCAKRPAVAPPPPPPPTCTGGRVRNNRGQCVCPSNKPIWTGKSCIPRATPTPPPQCTGGRVRNNRGQCVCPSNKPIWTGKACIPRATPTPPPQCTGGRVRNNRGQCVCPSNKPIWTGRSCIARVAPKPPPSCTGGQVWNARRKACVCPGNLRWNPNARKCVSPPQQTAPPQIKTVPQIQQLQKVPQLQQIVPRPPRVQ